MVKRNHSRPDNRAKLDNLQSFELDQFDEYGRENHLKRLDDFDRQVKDIHDQMEKEKQTTINKITNLYFCDDQRTSPSTNKMLWIDYLKQNSSSDLPKTVIRLSIVDLIDKTVEEAERRSIKKKDANKLTGYAAVIATSKKKMCQLNEYEATLSRTTRSKRGARVVPKSTPSTSGIHCAPSNLFITPKFDPRTPLPLNSVRRPKYGEIAVSFRGSPLQAGPKAYLDNLQEQDIDEKTKEELQEFHDKVSRLLGLSSIA